jgi:aspartate/methionine/tyrosine aminotransferase
VGERISSPPGRSARQDLFLWSRGLPPTTSNKGLYKLRLGLNRYLKSRHGLDYSPDDEILIT